MTPAAARPPTRLMIWNLVALNVGWFACVLAAAGGMPWVGPICVALLVAIHLYVVPAWRREAALIVTAGAFGYIADSIPTVLGIFAFPEQSLLGGPSPIWMVALWCNFAMAPGVALYWLAHRPLLASVLGLLGGPAAYYGGMQLGAMLTPSGTPVMLATVALEWALAMPLLMWASVSLGRWTGEPVPAEAV